MLRGPTHINPTFAYPADTPIKYPFTPVCGVNFIRKDIQIGTVHSTRKMSQQDLQNTYESGNPETTEQGATPVVSTGEIELAVEIHPTIETIYPWSSDDESCNTPSPIYHWSSDDESWAIPSAIIIPGMDMNMNRSVFAPLDGPSPESLPDLETVESVAFGLSPDSLPDLETNSNGYLNSNSPVDWNLEVVFQVAIQEAYDFSEDSEYGSVYGSDSIPDLETDDTEDTCAVTSCSNDGSENLMSRGRHAFSTEEDTDDDY